VRLLLEAGADPNARQEGGFMPLHAAAQNGDRESAEALLERGADASAATDDGTTPAQLAAAAGHDELADFVAPTPMR
jgi:cytohesin